MALLVTMLMLTLLAALGGSLIVITMAEARISAAGAGGTEAFYAAEGALEVVMGELAAASDWNQVLQGAVSSRFLDGSPSAREMVDGSILDLMQATNLVRCGRPSACRDGDLRAVTGERPWGVNNPRWQLFVSTPLPAMIAPASSSAMYVVVWVADDTEEGDGNPLVDENGTILLLAHAYGAGSVRRAIEAAIARSPDGLRMVTWREVR